MIIKYFNHVKEKIICLVYYSPLRFSNVITFVEIGKIALKDTTCD